MAKAMEKMLELRAWMISRVHPAGASRATMGHPSIASGRGGATLVSGTTEMICVPGVVEGKIEDQWA